jgi:hypothetical protein
MRTTLAQGNYSCPVRATVILTSVPRKRGPHSGSWKPASMGSAPDPVWSLEFRHLVKSASASTADYIFDEDILLVSEDGANLLARSTPIACAISGRCWVNNHAHVFVRAGPILTSVPRNGCPRSGAGDGRMTELHAGSVLVLPISAHGQIRIGVNKTDME